MSGTKMFQILSAVRVSYRTKKSVSILKFALNKDIRGFLHMLTEVGVIQGFEACGGALILILKSDKAASNNTIFQFNSAIKQYFRCNKSIPLSGLEKLTKQGLSSTLIFVSSDKGITDLREACRFKVGGRIFGAIK